MDLHKKMGFFFSYFDCWLWCCSLNMAGNHTGTDVHQSRNSTRVNDIHPAEDGVSGDDATQQRAARVTVYRVAAVISNKSRTRFTEKKTTTSKCVKVLTMSPVLFRAHNTPHIPHTRNWTDRERRKGFISICIFDHISSRILCNIHKCFSLDWLRVWSLFSALNRRVEHF